MAVSITPFGDGEGYLDISYAIPNTFPLSRKIMEGTCESKCRGFKPHLPGSRLIYFGFSADEN